ncbi:MAG: bifunctional nuclease family protein [Anaerolineae bacterium]|nr:bifunctional nuclease family protein [Anaerolineae bacterium]
MIEVMVETIQVSLVSPHRVVVLKEVEGERFLPIWIGACETEAIAMRLQGIDPPRPMTHDLMINLLDTLEAKLQYIFINSLKDETFHARLILQVRGREIWVDARPSDSIALAVRLEIPIFVHESVLDEAGIVPEPDLLEGKESYNDEKLDIFRDFLNRLDLDDLPTD